MGEALKVRRGTRFNPTGIAGANSSEGSLTKKVTGYSKSKSYLISVAGYNSSTTTGYRNRQTISTWLCIKGVVSCVGGVYLSGTGSMGNPYTDQVVVGEDTNLGRLAVSDDGTFTYTAKNTGYCNTGIFIAEL